MAQQRISRIQLVKTGWKRELSDCAYEMWSQATEVLLYDPARLVVLIVKPRIVVT